MWDTLSLTVDPLHSFIKLYHNCIAVFLTLFMSQQTSATFYTSESQMVVNHINDESNYYELLELCSFLIDCPHLLHIPSKPLLLKSHRTEPYHGIKQFHFDLTIGIYKYRIHI